METTKQYVVLKYAAARPWISASRYEIAPDYGDFAWGSALYVVLGYFPSYKAAQTAVREDRATNDKKR